MKVVIERIAIILWHTADFLFALSLRLHEDCQTDFWIRVEEGWRRTEERLEEMEQLEYLAGRGEDHD